MPKTTKGDGMERRAEKWLMSVGATNHVPDAYQQFYVESLTRLLRKVAREAEKRGYARGVHETCKAILVQIDKGSA